MKYIDLTHVMRPDMPVFPGTEKPVFEKPVSIEKDGFLETQFHMYSHTGTHMDAPAHLLQGQPYLNEMDVSQFCGKAVVLDVKTAKGWIEIEHLRPYEEQIQKADFVILKTGWSQFWGQNRYFEAFQCLSVEAVEWLVNKALKGIGLDTISIDPVDSKDMPNHKIVLGRQMVIIENLTNLDALEAEVVDFFCFPLKFEASDGSPIRAVAAY